MQRTPFHRHNPTPRPYTPTSPLLCSLPDLPQPIPLSRSVETTTPSEWGFGILSKKVDVGVSLIPPPTLAPTPSRPLCAAAVPVIRLQAGLGVPVGCPLTSPAMGVQHAVLGLALQLDCIVCWNARSQGRSKHGSGSPSEPHPPRFPFRLALFRQQTEGGGAKMVHGRFVSMAWDSAFGQQGACIRWGRAFGPNGLRAATPLAQRLCWGHCCCARGGNTIASTWGVSLLHEVCCWGNRFCGKPLSAALRMTVYRIHIVIMNAAASALMNAIL